MEEKILTLHPEGKRGVQISKKKYDSIRDAILATIGKHGLISFKDLTESIQRQLEADFEGSIPWYVVSVKLDLEARRLIERVPGSSPQQLRLAKGQQKVE